MSDQLKDVFSDEAFVKTLLDAENPEAVQKMLADKGVEMTIGEILLTGEIIGAAADGNIPFEVIEDAANSGELSDEELEQAAGGVITTTLHTGMDTFMDFLKTCKIFDLKSFNCDTNISTFSLSKYGVAGITIAGIGAAAGAAYGICKACGVDVAGGLSTAYGWCKDKITSRW